MCVHAAAGFPHFMWGKNIAIRQLQFAYKYVKVSIAIARISQFKNLHKDIELILCMAEENNVCQIHAWL